MQVAGGWEYRHTGADLAVAVREYLDLPVPPEDTERRPRPGVTRAAESGTDQPGLRKRGPGLGDQ